MTSRSLRTLCYGPETATQCYQLTDQPTFWPGKVLEMFIAYASKNRIRNVLDEVVWCIALKN